MRMFLVTAMAAAAVAALSPYPLAAQTPATAPAVTPPPPMVKPGELRKVSDHVQIIPDDSVQLVPNVGYVVGDKAVLVIDTGMGPKNGAAVSEIAQKLAGGTRAVYLVTTHFHPEHDLGAQAFPASTKLIRSEDQQKDIAEFGLQTAKVFASRGPVYADLLKDVDFRKPDIDFRQGLRPRSRRRARQADRDGAEPHARRPGDLGRAGPRAVHGRHRHEGAARLRESLFERASVAGSLDKLEALKPVLIVPSHGPTGDVGFISGYRTYLTDIRDRTAAEKRAGKTEDQAVAAVSAALPNYPDRGRLTGAIKAAYGEAP